MRHIPTDARHDVKTQEEYDLWVSKLQKGDRVMMQKFRPKKGNDTYEHWLFIPGRFEGDRAIVNGSTYFLKEGVCTCLNSQNPLGDTFVDRIVPWCDDLAPNPDRIWTIANAPIFEPTYQKRCFVFVPYASELSYGITINKMRDSYPCSYQYPVHKGIIVIIFEDPAIVSADLGEFFLYSENC